MTIKKHFECDECGAVFELAHEMDTDYYEIKVCPFCSNKIEDEDQFDIEDIE